MRGAREHNLRNVSIDLPRDQLIVFTGLSGSGKSSLAFDTIFAEGQRRYVESLSSYARQFLGQMDKPDVDFIEGLSPAVSIDQKSTNRNPRSTVGTITEVYDYLRLLFARAGTQYCPVCGERVTAQTPQQIVDRLREMPEGTRFQVLAPMVRGRKGEYQDLFRDLQSQGYARARVDGQVVPLSEPPTLEKKLKHNIEVVVDRLVVRENVRQRLTDSVETALRLADGLVVVDFVDLDPKDPGRERRFSEKRACPNDHPLTLEEIEPRTFSFNAPYGACPECTGIGSRLEVDPSPGRAGRGAQPRRGRRRAVGLPARVLPAADVGPGGPAGLLHGRALARPARPRQAGHPRGQRLRGEGPLPQPVGPGAGVHHRLRGRHHVHQAQARRDRVGVVARALRGLHARGAVPGLQGQAAQARGARRARGRAQHRRAVRPAASPTAKAYLSDLRLGVRETAIAGQVLKEIHARLGFLLDVGLTYLTLSRARRHALRRRGPAHPAGHPDRHRAWSACSTSSTSPASACTSATTASSSTPSPGCATWATPSSSSSTTRTPSGSRTGSSTSAPAPASTAGRSCTPATSPGLLATEESVTGAYLSGRRQIAMPAQRRQVDKKRQITVVGRPREQPPGRHRLLPARHLRRRHRRVRLGQVHPGQRDPVQGAGQRAQRRPRGARPAQAGDRAWTTSTRSSTSTSRRSGARRGRTRPPTPGCGTRSASCSRRPPRRRCAATAPGGSPSTSRAAAARPARATARSRSR